MFPVINISFLLIFIHKWKWHCPLTPTSPHLSWKTCFPTEITSIILHLLAAYVEMMPLYFYILVVCYKTWRRERLTSPFTKRSHSDVFTYNVLVLDMLNVLATLFLLFGALTEKPGFQWAGSVLFSIFIPGQTLFHLLTCMEYYLAVLHPIFYVRLKGSLGFRARNIIIACIWLTSVVIMILIIRLINSFSMCSFLFLQHLCSLCSDSFRARQEGQNQREGWAIKAESFV